MHGRAYNEQNITKKNHSYKTGTYEAKNTCTVGTKYGTILIEYGVPSVGDDILTERVFDLSTRCTLGRCVSCFRVYPRGGGLNFTENLKKTFPVHSYYIHKNL
jgi:hypothetical protein